MDKDRQHARPRRSKVQSPDYSEEVGWSAFIRRCAERWPKLTQTDLDTLDQIAFAVGNYEGLVGRLRERYGMNEEEARREADVFLQGFLGGGHPKRQHGVS